MSSNSRPQREQDTRWDQYYTPPWPTRILCEFLGMGDLGVRVYEPCAGNGGIVDVLHEYDAQVRARDLAPNTPYPPLDFVSEDERHEAATFENATWADWIITNPPYQSRRYKAEDFVERAIGLNDQVALLVRQSFGEPTKGRGEERKGRQWLFEYHPPDFKLVLPRVHYGGPDGKKGDSDSGNSETSVWMIWMDGKHNQNDCRTRWYTHEDKEMAKGQQFLDI